MSKYYMLVENPKGEQKWLERDGERLKNKHGLELYIENVSKIGRNYVITEAYSGLQLAGKPSRKEAIAEIDKIVEMKGIDVINKDTEKYVDTFGLSPLFTKKEESNE